MERRQGTQRCDLEHRTVADWSALLCRPVKVSVASLEQSSEWTRPIVTNKEMERRDYARRGNPEHRAFIKRAAFLGCAVKIAIHTLDKPGARIRSVAASQE